MAQRLEDAELAIDGVGRLQKFSRRLATQHVASALRLEHEGRVGLAAGKLCRDQRPPETGNPVLEIPGQLVGIELVNVVGHDECLKEDVYP